MKHLTYNLGVKDTPERRTALLNYGYKRISRLSLKISKAQSRGFWRRKDYEAKEEIEALLKEIRLIQAAPPGYFGAGGY